MEKSSVLRFIFILVFIGVIAFPLTYFSVKKLLGNHNHVEHRHGFSVGVKILRHMDDDIGGDPISDHDSRYHKYPSYSDLESDYTSGIVSSYPPSSPSQIIPDRSKRKKSTPKLSIPPFIHLSDEMRNSIETHQYSAHSVSCFDQITKTFYICDNRIHNSQLSCPIIHPGHKIQIISENHEVYHNITRDTTSCFIMWFNQNPDKFSTKKVTIDDVIRTPSNYMNEPMPTPPPSPYRTHPSNSPSQSSKK